MTQVITSGLQKASTPPSSRENPIKDQEKYLESNGWTFLYYNQAGVSVWEKAPPTTKSELRPAAVLPVQGGGTEVVMQWHGPPCAWRYQLGEAVIVQRGYDAESLDDQIVRREAELKDLKAKARAEAEKGLVN